MSLLHVPGIITSLFTLSFSFFSLSLSFVFPFLFCPFPSLALSLSLSVFVSVSLCLCLSLSLSVCLSVSLPSLPLFLLSSCHHCFFSFPLTLSTSSPCRIPPSFSPRLLLPFLQLSFDLSEYTADVDGVGTLRLLDAIRTCGLEKEVRFYQVRLFLTCVCEIDQ